MKTLRYLFLLAIVSFPIITSAQSLAPPKIWDKRFGGNSYENIYCFCPLSDGTFLAGGTSSSDAGGDKTQNNWGKWDYWIVKIDAQGNKIWDKRYGYTYEETPNSMIQLSNGKILLVGWSSSPAGGDKTQNQFGGNYDQDFWIVCIDKNGTKIWDKIYGGTSNDEAYSAVQATNNSIFICGISNSTTGGNKTSPSYGNGDSWIIKIDTSGNLLNQTTIGGSSGETPFSIDISDDGYLYCGMITGSSASGNISSSTYGGSDYLVCKLDQSLNIIWQKRLGGSSSEYAAHAGCSHGKISISGYTNSPISGNKTDANCNDYDFWDVNLDASGNIINQKTYGGSSSDDTQGNLFVTNEGNILVVGTSYSGISCEKTQSNLGNEQTWAVLFDTLNNLIWDRTVLDMGHNEVGYCCQLANGSFILGNSSSANTGGDKTQNSQGGNDYFMICLAAAAPPEANFTANNILCPNTCTTFSYTGSLYPVGTLQWSFPGGNPSTATGYSAQVCYSTSGYYSAQVIASNALGNDTLVMNNYIHVLQNVSPTLSYNNQTLYCATGVSSVTFQWYLNGSAIAGATDSVFHPLINGNYVVTVNAGSPCPVTLSQLVTNLPAYIQSITSNATYLCPTNCLQFVATTFNTPTTYQWIFQGGSPATSNQICPSNICYANPGNYDVTLIISNSYGNDTLYLPNYIHVLSLNPQIVWQNDTLLCNTTALTYQWYLNGSMISGATHQWYFPSQPGNYQVMATSSIGCSVFSNLITAGTPVASFTLSSGSVCEGDCIQFTNSSTLSPSSFQWNFAGGTPSSSVLASPTVCFNSQGQFNVSLIVSNQFGSDTFNCNSCVTVQAIPQIPTISQSGNILSCSVTATYYQWYLNGQLIGGANSQTYTASQNGYYSVQIFGSNGCSSTSNQYIFILNTLPTAVFTSDYTTVCANFCIQFNDQSLNNPNSWLWSFPGGTPSSSTSQNPLVCYYTAGTYNVTLITHNTFGYDTLLFPNYVTVYSIPSSIITQSNDSLLAPPGAFLYQWLLNGNNISGATNSFYMPTTGGSYNVICFNQFGCVGSNFIPYQFYPAPVASFSNSSVHICEGSCILFNSTSTNQPNDYLWLFPGGSPTASTQQNPTACYYSSGQYNVELIVTNGSGSDTLVMNNYVTVQSSPVPQLTLNGNMLTCTTGAAGPFTYHWLENGVLLAGITDSFYQAVSGGVYNVVVTNALGCSSYTNDVVVNVSFAPDANFTASDTTICEGICVDYSDASVNFPSTWSWSFPGGNPSSSTAQNVTVCYPAAGNYDVTLITGNSFGYDTIHYSNYVLVQSASPPTISQSHDTLFATAAGAISFQWYNNSGVINGATHNYYLPTSNGNYSAASFFPNGCSAVSNSPYSFFTAPVVEFSCTDSIICAGDCIDFFDLSTNNPTSWTWNFQGTGSTISFLQNPANVCFLNPGQYDVTLSASNQTGTGTQLISQMIIVNPIPNPTLTYNSGHIYCNLSASNYSFSWFIDGVFIAGASSNNIASVGAGTYTVQAVDNTTGCRGTSAGLVLTGIEVANSSSVHLYSFNNELVVTDCNQLSKITLYNSIGQLLNKTIIEKGNLCTIQLDDFYPEIIVAEILTKKDEVIHQLIIKH